MVRIDSPEVQAFEKAHLSTLRSLAPECMVLLKKNGDFPLSSPCEIALYGAGARETIKGGTGSGDVNVRHYVTVEEGLEYAGFTVTTKAWLDGYKAAREAAIQGFYEGIAKEAKELGKSVFLVGMGRTPAEPQYALPIEGEGDVCIYVLSRNSGEGADRPGGEGDYILTGDEVRDILACAEKYPKFMLVLNVGGPVDISPVLDKVENVLLLSQLGSVLHFYYNRFLSSLFELRVAKLGRSELFFMPFSYYAAYSSRYLCLLTFSSRINFSNKIKGFYALIELTQKIYFTLFPIIHHPVQFLPPPCPCLVYNCTVFEKYASEQYYSYLTSLRPLT